MKRPRFALITSAWLAASPLLTAQAEELTGSVRGTLTVVGHPFPRAKLFLHPQGR
jgi:hypothetical protein